MNYKKTWFSWLNFVICSGFLSVVLFTLFVSVYEYAGLTTFLFGFVNLSFVLSVLSVIGLILLFFLLSFLKKSIHISAKDSRGIKIVNIISYILFALVCAFTVYEVINIYLSSFTNGFSYDVKELNSLYGMVYSGVPVFSRPYTYISVFILKLFGEDILYLYSFDLLMYLLGSILLYIALHKLFGSIPALCSFSFLIFICNIYKPYTQLNSLSLTFFLVAFFIFIIASVMKLRKKGYMLTNANVIFFIIFGIITGISISVNIVFLLIFLALCVLFSTAKVDDSAKEIAINRNVLPSVSYLISGICSFFASLFVFSLLKETNFYEEILYALKDISLIPDFEVMLPSYWSYECIVVLTLALFSALSLIVSKKNDRNGLVLFVYILFSVAYSFSIFKESLNLWFMILYGLLFGMGINEVFIFGYGQKVSDISESEDLLSEDNLSLDEVIDIENLSSETKENIEDINETNDSSMDTQVITISDIINGSDKLNNPAIVEDIYENTETESEALVITVNSILNNAEETDSRDIDKLAMIDNPLKLPKKKAKSENLDYSYIPRNNQMEFDIDIKPGDDFDI